MALDKRQADVVLSRFEGEAELHEAWAALLRKAMAHGPISQYSEPWITAYYGLLDNAGVEWTTVATRCSNSLTPTHWRQMSEDAWNEVVDMLAADVTNEEGE